MLTFGEFTTDVAQHGITKVPGLVRFTLDVRSDSDEVLDAFEQTLNAEVSRISRARNVQIDLGPITKAPTEQMTEQICESLEQAARAIGAPSMQLPSGGGHDCAVFAGLGVPVGMLFIRNENGSHNPDEHMAFEDFAIACDVLHHRVPGEVFLNA